MNPTYINAVRLLLAVAPVVFRKPLFVLKGGTAINLFIRDMPRLSVDLDLVCADLHHDELYGSKLVAVMDRQHPRDLFDVLGLYAHGGLTPGIVECFVCYLAGHNRPVHEVLFGNEIDIRPAFANDFEGMTREPVVLEVLIEVQRRLMAELPKALTDQHRSFLSGLVRCEPDWSLMQCPHLEMMPAIRWKLENLARLKRTNPSKFSRQAEELTTRLSR